MDNKRPQTYNTRRSSAANNNRNSNKSSTKQSKSSYHFTPALAAVIALAIVCVICIPLIVATVNKTSSASSENIITAEQLGYSVVKPEQNELSVSSNNNETVIENNPSDILFEKGDQDESIKQIQLKLMSHGYMAENEPTDLFGPATEEAVKLFQSKHELNYDGKITQETYDLLFSENVLYYTVGVGSNGSDIATIQSLLSKLGYFSGNSTGYFGTETESAVKNFQKANGLTADGKVGINTLSVLKSPNAVVYTPPSPSPSPSGQSETL